MTKVVVDRQKWLRGEGSADSYLLRSKDSKMCCLGFACVALGVKKELLEDLRTPCNLYSEEFDKLKGLITRNIIGAPVNKITCSAAMSLNDCKSISDAEREEELIEAGKKMDIEFEFC